MSLTKLNKHLVAGSAMAVALAISTGASADGTRTFAGTNGRVSVTVDFFSDKAAFYRPVNDISGWPATPGRFQEPSQDGKKIVWATDTNASAQKSAVGVTDVVAGTNYLINTVAGAAFSDVHWSPKPTMPGMSQTPKLLYRYQVNGVSTIAYQEVDNLAAPKPPVVVAVGRNLQSAVWNPNGTKILYTRSTLDVNDTYGGEVRLYTLRTALAAPSEELIASESVGHIGRATYSGANDRVVYTFLSQDLKSAAIRLLDYNLLRGWLKSTVSTTATSPLIYATAMWSPDGNRVAWIANRANASGHQLVVATRNSSGVYVPAFVSGSGDASPESTSSSGSVAFSPDSKLLIYYSGRRKQVFTIPVGGGSATLRYTGAAHDLAWGVTF